MKRKAYGIFTLTLCLCYLVCSGMLVTLNAAVTTTHPVTLNNQTIRFGSMTLALSGGAQAQAADGSYVNFDSIVSEVSGDSKNWTISGGRLVSEVALAGRSSAVLRCAAQGAEFDVTIQIDPGSADMASMQEFAAVFTLGDHGGQRFYFRPATVFDMSTPSMHGRMGGQSSEVIFDCRDPVNRAQIKYFQLATAAGTPVENLTFQNLHFKDAKAELLAKGRSTILNFGTNPLHQPMARNIKIQDCVFELDFGYGRLGDKPVLSAGITAISFRCFPENITIRRNEFINHGIAISFVNGCRDTLITENICRLGWSDFLRFSYLDVTNEQIVFPDTERVRVSFNAIYDPAADNSLRHVDTVQTFQNARAGFPGAMGDIELIGNLSFMGAEGLRQPPPLSPMLQTTANRPVSEDFTIPASDFLPKSESSVQVDVDTTSGPVTVTLPDMSTVGSSTRLYVAKVSNDANPVTIVDPSGIFSTVELTNVWEQNTYNKVTDTTGTSVRGITGSRAIHADHAIAASDFTNGTTLATTWRVDTSSGPVTLYLPDMRASPVKKTMNVSKISADTNPVILRMSVPGQTMSLQAAADGAGETVTEYRLKSRWAGVTMLKQSDTSVSVSASAPNLAGFRIQRFYYNGVQLPYPGMAVVGNLMYVTDLLYRPEAPVDNLVLAYNTGIAPHSGDVNGDGSVDIHDGYNPSSPELEWYYVTNGIRRPEAFGNISETFGVYYQSPKNGIDLDSGNLKTMGYTDAQYEALFDVDSADNLQPLTVQQAIDMSKTRSSGPGVDYGVHQLINFSTRADGRGLTGTFKDNSAPEAPTADASISGNTATITITPNGTAAVHEYGSRVWYLVDGAASHAYKEITEQGDSRYVRGSADEKVTVQIPDSGPCYLHMARRSINTQTVVSVPVQLR